MYLENRILARFRWANRRRVKYSQSEYEQTLVRLASGSLSCGLRSLRSSKIEPSRFSIGLESWKDKPAVAKLADGFMTLCRSLLNAGLVDRFRVVVFPVITGSSGRDRIYDGIPDVSFDMVSSRTCVVR